jgi:predicted GNAT family N-acyltransferase
MDVKLTDYQDYIEKIKEVRGDVFVKEQNVPVNLEIDGLDSEAKHVIVFDDDGDAIGTGRMLPDGHIGRIAVKKQYRGKGIGMMIMENLIEYARESQLPKVWLSSQYHAKDFYRKLDFVQAGDIYQEAGIDHIKMEKAIS